METIEQRIETFSDEWQDYCLPDKVAICQPKINSFLEEIEKLLTENSKQSVM